MPPKSATLKYLQKKCTAEELDISGTTVGLIKCLETEKNRNRQVLIPESQHHTEYDAISKIGHKEVMQTEVQHTLRETLQEVEFYEEGMKEDYFVVKPHDTPLDRLVARMDSLDQKIASSGQGIASLRLTTTSLEDQVNDLHVSLEAYKLQRNRFIGIFKRDKLGDMTEADRRFIGEGNKGGHGGDAVADASLYTGTDPRRDFSVFETLYAFHPQTVLRMRHQETIDVLNTHAGVLASNNETGSHRFYSLFAQFVRLFKQSGKGYDEGYLDGISTDVTNAYLAFVNCINTEVRRVEVSD